MKAFAIPLLSLLVLATPAGAHDHDAPVKEAAVAAPIAAAGSSRDARAYFTDLELVTQDGRKVRFYTDAMEGRTVVINTIYTSCKDACPLITQKMQEIRAQIGDRFGREVFFLTLSTDPARDTPERMKAYAREQGADVPGWLFLTGSRQNLGQVLKKLGLFSEVVEEHSTVLIAGNVPAKRWTKFRPETHPALIAERLKTIADATQDAANAH
jgi:cytochrome oxidase Cu insertion factor (SCO1/SenC/PrrC family)